MPKFPIIKRPLPGDTPAACSPAKQEIYIDPEKTAGLSRDIKRFMLFHEEGHLVNGNGDEIAADAYAFQKYAESGGSMKKAVQALSHVLSFEGVNADEQKQRLDLQTRRALLFDGIHNNNKPALHMLHQSTQANNIHNVHTPLQVSQAGHSRPQRQAQRDPSIYTLPGGTTPANEPIRQSIDPRAKSIYQINTEGNIVTDTGEVIHPSETRTAKPAIPQSPGSFSKGLKVAIAVTAVVAVAVFVYFKFMKK